jgi:hypothetical protein
MSEFARVTSIEALKDFRAELCTFGEQAIQGLLSVQMAAQRTLDWIDEQINCWQREVRRWEDAVIEARTELARRKMIRIGDRVPDCTEQEKILRLARMRLEESQEKLARTRRWQPQFRRALDEYHGPGRQLSSFLEAQLPRALALLQQKIDSLEAYVRLSAPSEPGPV